MLRQLAIHNIVLVERLASRRAEATGLVGEPVASEGGAL